jgi:phage terminase Nu1 subunit (DNA packaging protein)
MSANTVTIPQLCSLLGIDINEVSRLAKRGIIHSTDGGVLFDLVLSIRGYADYLKAAPKDLELDENQLARVTVTIPTLQIVCGIGDNAVHKAAKRYEEKGATVKKSRGQYLLLTFLQQYIAEKKHGLEVVTDTDNELDPAFQRARVDKERADKLALENAKKRGELRDSEAFYMINAQIAQQTIAMLESLASRVSSKLAAKLDVNPELVRNAIQSEIDAGRREILEAGFAKYAEGFDDLDEPVSNSI